MTSVTMKAAKVEAGSSATSLMVEPVSSTDLLVGFQVTQTVFLTSAAEEAQLANLVMTTVGRSLDRLGRS